jgi:hypothetical protein
MTTESVSYTRRTCDRCGFEQDCHDNDQSRPWSHLSAQRADGSAILPYGYKGDLCPMCSGSLQDWWREKAALTHPGRGK